MPQILQGYSVKLVQKLVTTTDDRIFLSFEGKHNMPLNIILTPEDTATLLLMLSSYIKTLNREQLLCPTSLIH